MPAVLKAGSEAIRDEFLRLEISVDELLVHPDDAKAFALQMLEQLSGTSFSDVPSILRELIRLRKIGEDRGGIPRRKRANKGRPPRPR